MQLPIHHKVETMMATTSHDSAHREASILLIGGGNFGGFISGVPTLLCVLLLFSSLSLRAQTPSTSRKDTIFIYNTVKILILGDSLKGRPAPMDGAMAAGVVAAPDTLEDYDLKPIFALRSNLLVPLLNVGIQIPIGNRFSVGIDWYYPFIRREWSENLDQTNCFEALGPGVDFRYYFGKKHSKGRENWLYRLSGHSVGVFGMFGRYDWEREFWGHQANFVNVGVDYMWSSRIGKKKRMRLDMSIGVGAFFSHGTEYHVFRPKGDAYRTGKKKNITWIGPNKATISLVIPIYTKIRKKAVNE